MTHHYRQTAHGPTFRLCQPHLPRRLLPHGHKADNRAERAATGSARRI